MLIVVFLVALYFRIQLPYANSIQGGRIIISDFDPYYHLRIVEYTLQNFPRVLAFDPYVDFPNGFWIGWPPLYDFLASSYAMAAMALFHVDYQVAVATFPALLGAVAIFPVYYITKLIFDWKAGVVAAALLTALPANLLRSMVGNLNHHVAAEVLFPVFLFLFFMLALKGGLTFHKLRTISFTSDDKRTLLYAGLAGIFVTALLLTWLGGFLFLGIIGAFAIVQFIIYHLRRMQSDNLVIVAVTMLLVSLATFLPLSLLSHFGTTIDPLHVSLFQPLLLLALLVIFVLFGWLAYCLSDKQLALYPLAICTLLAVGGIGFYLLRPDLATTVFTGYGFFTQTGVLQTIAEAQPLFGGTGGFQLTTAASYFQVLLFAAFIGLAVLGYRLLKKQDEAALLLFVWSVFAVAITIVQTRFTFLLSANVAILSAFVIVWALDVLVGKAYGTLLGVHDAGELRDVFGHEIKYTQLIGVFFVVLVLLLPSINMNTAYAKNVQRISPDWDESLMWMEANTPPTTNFNVSSDQRPEYGVLSWWDYGNWIIYLGHRPAVANNFQTGVGDTAQFFTSQNESDTVNIIQNRNVKYIMTDYEIADYNGKFQAIALLSGKGIGTFLTPQAYYTQSGALRQQLVPTEAYYSSTVVRLEFLDGNGYGHYRLVHESNSTVGTFGGTEVKYVKVFEYVTGANITVRGDGNATLSLKVTTNQNRTFNYTQSAIINGSHTFIVPYLTNWTFSGMQTGNTYTITVGNSTQSIAVSESDVTSGKEPVVSF
jgi:dolichyl-diphosphooligosaccharide--protein glycosyltransferase